MYLVNIVINNAGLGAYPFGGSSFTKINKICVCVRVCVCVCVCKTAREKEKKTDTDLMVFNTSSICS